MYKSPFYITNPVGNNAFSFEHRVNKKLFVPNIKKIKYFDEIELGNEIVFEDFDFNDHLSSCKGLKNFYEINWEGKKLYLFDNHNHALYFWYLARYDGMIGNNNTLIHVDEHADMRDPGVYLSREHSQNLQKVFDFTNFELNVGNYIIPAQKEGIISEVIQIRNETNLQEYTASFSPGGKEFKIGGNKDIILNLDLDFFQPDLDFIDYDLKKQVVLDAAKKAKVITIATSPFFIEQSLALKVFKDIFGEKI